jgi:hypothetical protein
MTICKGYHTLLTRLADPEDSLSSDDADFRLELGEDSAASPSYTDTGTSSKIARTDVTDYINEGTTLYTSTFVDSTEANPTGGGNYQSIHEIAIIAVVDSEGVEYCCNHSTINEVQKDNQKTATIEASLKLNDDTTDS